MLRAREFRPDIGVRQAIVLVLAWLHGCIGMHFWLRLQPWYGRVAPWLFAVAILLPTLALLGFVQAGREVAPRPVSQAGAKEPADDECSGRGSPPEPEQGTHCSP